MRTLKAPFPWFGGKARVAPAIWQRFGDTPNYVEPFAGSLAVLLDRPHRPRIETVNDRDSLLANFWRSLRADPEQVAHYAQWPVSEIDLHARHQWLASRRLDVEAMLADPDYYDVRAAGWWVWGIGLWIGSGWCEHPEWRGRGHAGRKAVGVHGQQVRQQLPSLSGDSGATGQGVHASGLSKRGVEQWLVQLAERLRHVRVCCGDWTRVVTPAVTTGIGATAVLLDPLYDLADRTGQMYAHDDDIAADVRCWAIANGDNSKLRIALCGYDTGEWMPDGWTSYRWKAQGGYGNPGQGRGRENAKREIVWFSPHCLLQPTLFDLKIEGAR